MLYLLSNYHDTSKGFHFIKYNIDYSKFQIKMEKYLKFVIIPYMRSKEVARKKKEINNKLFYFVVGY